MPKVLFHEEAEEELQFETNNEYANKYDTWRQKEEIHKLQTKYGEEVAANYFANGDVSDSSSEDDEVGVEFTENVEKDFYKTLSLLKNKDPKIYDRDATFFEANRHDKPKTDKKKAEKPMYLNDYERKLLLEKGGVVSDTDEEPDEDDARSGSPTYIEEQKRLKDSFKNVGNSDDEEADWGGLFKKRQKTSDEENREEEDYKMWLKGKRDDISDKDTATQLKPLKDYWNDPKLDRNEQFLRDYILNKRFLDGDNEDHIPTYDEIVHDSDDNLSEDEKAIEKQEEFEHKYNFRFEEPDQEFIKRYPRTMEHSLRKTDDRRKLKRAEVKERKEREKLQKKEELKQLKAMKRKEIEDKIVKLREITGNTSLGFEDQDFDEDFDPDAYDKRMKELFDEEYYKEEEIQKPECSDVEEELEIENWDKFHRNQHESMDNSENPVAPHCEDDDFIMDCDYDPEAVQKDVVENSKTKKRKGRQSKFAKAVTTKKPIFNPNDKTYQEYLDEYYQLDYEDMIGDVPCRFKYRSVVPNSFGLSIEEILLANDRELNKWCSLKKAVQFRPDNVEKYEVIAYEKKGQNETLKRKALPSLYQENDDIEENANHHREEESADEEAERPDNIPSNPVIEEDKVDEAEEQKPCEASPQPAVENDESSSVPAAATKKKKRRRKSKSKAVQTEPKQQEIVGHIEKNEPSTDVKPKKRRRRKSKAQKVDDAQNTEKIAAPSTTTTSGQTKRKRKRGKSSQQKDDTVEKKQKIDEGQKKIEKITKKRRNSKSRKVVSKPEDKLLKLSDARLQAYGINPKKYKNKIKYAFKKK